MKNSIFSLIILTSLSLTVSCSSSTNSSAQEAVREFYVQYIKAASQFPPDMAQLDALIAAHCTEDFRERLQNSEPDADPILDLQDVDKKIASTLQVTPSDGDSEVFQVCMDLGAGQGKHCVQVKVEEVDGEWKIADVIH